MGGKKHPFNYIFIRYTRILLDILPFISHSSSFVKVGDPAKVEHGELGAPEVPALVHDSHFDPVKRVLAQVDS